MSSDTIPVRKFTVDETTAWRGLLAVQLRVLDALDRELIRQHRMPVREFDVLITLLRAPHGRLRMSELAERVLLSPSGLTRMVERLERAGWVQRRIDPDDARSYHAMLTESGAQRTAEARITHNTVIRSLFFDRLDDAEVRGLGAIWKRVLREDAPLLDDEAQQAGVGITGAG